MATPGPLTLSITALGSVPAGRMARRTGVRPGDRLYVTGGLGAESGRGALFRLDLPGVRGLVILPRKQGG